MAKRRVRENQEDAEALYSAAVRNNTGVLETLLQRGVPANIWFERYGTTALHGAVFSRHAAATEVLLRHGASKTLPNYRGETAISINREMGSDEIFALLNPEVARQRALRRQQLTVRQDQYRAAHQVQHGLDKLHQIADEYRDTEKVTGIQNAEDALKYIEDAIYYTTLDSLEAEKFEEGSDERWNISSRVVRMMSCVSGCAHYLDQNHTALLQRSTGVNWKTLAQFVRMEQYHPNFLSHINYQSRAGLIRSTLHRAALDGELEALGVSCNQLQQDPTFRQENRLVPNFLRLSAFLNDEYVAQYIEEGIKNWRENVGLQDVNGRARLLRSIMMIGEAFAVASPVVQSQFDPAIITKFINARDVLCHPERPANRAAIEAIMKGGLVLQVNGNPISLISFANDMESMKDIPTTILRNYRFEAPPTLMDIHAYGSDAVWDTQVNRHVPMPPQFTFSKMREQYDRKPHKTATDRKDLHTQVDARLASLRHTPVAYRTGGMIDEIRDIEHFKADESLADGIAALQTSFLQWVDVHDEHKGRKKQELRAKLADPNTAVRKMKGTLDKYEGEYKAAQQKSESGLSTTKEETKLLRDYASLLSKYQSWLDYSTKKTELERVAHDSRTLADETSTRDSRTKTVSLVRFCQRHANEVESLFQRLNGPRRVHQTSGGYKSRGFGSHPDHQVLEFFQVMVGSCARALLENQQFMDKAPERLREVLAESAKPSRGYLAHIGIRQDGKPFLESKDRPEVFYTNSKHIVEAVPMLHAVAYALDHNILYDVAVQRASVVVLQREGGR